MSLGENQGETRWENTESRKHGNVHFQPDVPKETLEKFSSSAVSLQGRKKQHQQMEASKLEYQKQKQAQKLEQEDDRDARFVNTDYSTFDSKVSEKQVAVFYCSHCGQYCFVSSNALEDCPIRKTDSARVLDLSENFYKSDLNDGGVVTIRRAPGKLERQYRLQCKSCAVPVAYKFKPDLRDCQFLYFLDDALSEDPVHFQRKVRKIQEFLASTQVLSDII